MPRNAQHPFGVSHLVHAALGSMNCTLDDFATTHHLARAQLAALIDGAPVPAELPLAVVVALGWTARDALDHLAEISAIETPGGSADDTPATR